MNNHNNVRNIPQNTSITVPNQINRDNKDSESVITSSLLEFIEEYRNLLHEVGYDLEDYVKGFNDFNHSEGQVDKNDVIKNYEERVISNGKSINGWLPKTIDDKDIFWITYHFTPRIRINIDNYISAGISDIMQSINAANNILFNLRTIEDYRKYLHDNKLADRDIATLFYAHLSLGRLSDMIIEKQKPKVETLTCSSKAGNAKHKKTRKKTPTQFLKETRERHVAKILADCAAKGERITAERLGNTLGCHKSTVTRLKAWKKRDIIGGKPPPKGFNKQNEDADRPDYEAIDESTPDTDSIEGPQ